MVNINIVRVLLSKVVNLNCKLQQFDVKNALLHGDPKKEICMEVPPSFESKINKDVMCRLRKALYGRSLVW